MNELLEFFRGKRVFVTGHTSFKGAWLCKMLSLAGAEVTGYSLNRPTNPNLFELSSVADLVTAVGGDVRDLDALHAAFELSRPEIAFHLAAQPIVRLSYQEPHQTFETNVMGTVNFLECLRTVPGVRSAVNITTDKVYENLEWEWPYRESDRLMGADPYSNSKSCSELVTHSYRKSFFADGSVAISTGRSGNVIGGGDFGRDRIIPDCVRAAEKGQPIIVRNPHSIRPYQHVLEPLTAYLTIARAQYLDPACAGSYNVGPSDEDCVNTGTLVDMFCAAWGDGLAWIDQHDGGPHEASFLKLDCSRIRQTLGWRSRWHVNTAVAATVEWTKAYLSGADVGLVMEEQIRRYFA
ncbi:MAG TPA: CDP-glucose 4,6-dehydratase [Bacillota bacterium]|nr:CDP-glucose 4,6-dehydratase [Bacillota bacterium]